LFMPFMIGRMRGLVASAFASETRLS